MNKINLEIVTKMEQGYLTGLFIGDGYCYYNKKDRHYQVNFYLNPINDKEIIDYLLILLRKINANYFIHNEKSFNCFRIRVNSKILMIKLNELKNYFLKFKMYNKDFITGVISGFIDADGYVNNGEILLTQKDFNVISRFKEEINFIGVKTLKFWSIKNYKSNNLVYRLRVSTKFKLLSNNSQKVLRKYNLITKPL